MSSHRQRARPPKRLPGRRISGPTLRGAGFSVATALCMAAGLCSVLLATTLLAVANPLWADGGTLRVANVPMGAYRVNVYTDPTPISPDSIDVSVLATFERGRGVALGLEIEVVARHVDVPGPEIRHPATRDQAEDPRFYAAKFALGSEGNWEITVRVKGPEGAGEVAFEVEVREPGLFGNPYLILTVALLPLILVGWWLRRTGSVSSPSSRPGD